MSTWVQPNQVYRDKTTGDEVKVTKIEFRPTGAVLIRFHFVDAPDLTHRLWATEFQELYRS